MNYLAAFGEAPSTTSQPTPTGTDSSTSLSCNPQDHRPDDTLPSQSSRRTPHTAPKPRRSLSHPHALSISTDATKKSRHAEPGTSGVHAERSVSSLTAAIDSNTSNNAGPALSLFQRLSRQSASHSGIEKEKPLEPAPHSDRVDGRPAPSSSPPPLPIETDRKPTSKQSRSDWNFRRWSGGSTYTLPTVKETLGHGWPPSNTSEHGRSPASALSFMSTGNHVNANGSPDSTVSNVQVTTTSGGPQAGNVGAGPHQLVTRDAHAQPLDLMRRSQRTDTMRSQPDRSRSRAQRRFSGSTVTSSHSPSSDRGPHQREKEETKPAPFGVIGICALDVKARSKPSRNILNRIISNRDFDVVVFGDKVILDEEIENWPLCDYLISFYSDGFPLEKAIAYVKARKPFCVNDVPMQKILWDRRLCLHLLDKIQVQTPTRLEVSRDGGPATLNQEVIKQVKEVAGVTLDLIERGTASANPVVDLIDDGDTLRVDGRTLSKPFVEKPTSGEDHNIIIYFPASAGGGARKLFRKIGNKSSDFVPELTVPRAITESGSSYIYESFMQVDNAEDVKAYTVGSNYCHAETRKSPVVDGVVRRNTHGKELRYVTALSPEEKEVASKISSSFGQRVCGFDLLRADGKSYVIDVNGWSFVKDNEEYYDQSAKILKDMFIREHQRRGAAATPQVPSPAASDVDPLARAAQIVKERDQLSSTVPASSTGKAAENAPSGLDITKGDGGALRAPVANGGTSPAAESILVSAIQSTSTSPLPTTTFGELGAIPASSNSWSAHTEGPNTDEVEHGEAEIPAPPAPKHAWRLKGMVSVIRHADRTPKQKYKFTFHTEPFIALLKGHQEEVLLIGEAALASVVQAVDTAFMAGVEDVSKLKALRNVLVKKGSWAGTKVQIKPMFRKKKTEEQKAVTEMAELKENMQVHTSSDAESPSQEHPIGRSPKRQDSLSGVTMSKFTAAEERLVLDKLQLIVKWGGEPTHSARYQAQELGENMRNDLMLMNRDILDEVHVFSSSERRVTTSAQIWAASFLGKKDIPDDFITIRKDLLDDSNAAKDETDKVKKKLKGLLREGNERPAQFAWPENMPEPSEVQNRVAQLMKFHRRVMQHNYTKLYSGAANSLSAISNPSTEKLATEGSSSSLASSLSHANAMTNIQARWCCGEDAELFRERWEKLFAEFCDGDKVDPSKISELYDTMKFDALHNRQFLEWVFTPSKQQLEEEYGTRDAKETKETKETKEMKVKESEESKAADDRRSDKSMGISPPDGAGQMDASNRSTSVKKLFRRRSFLNGLRHLNNESQPEQYFRLYKGANQQTTPSDPRSEPLQELYKLAKMLFDFICPQEYGISDSEKLEIGLLTSLPLLKEIVQDLEEMQASNDAKSFFYFTKESHIYTLLNCIIEGGIETKIDRSTIPELDYLSQICFELYESEVKLPTDQPAPDAPQFTYSIRITISPGCHVFDPLHVQLDSRHCIGCAPRRSLTPHGDWLQVIKTLRAKFTQVKLPKTFLAVNLSDAFSFEEHEQQSAEDARGNTEAGAESPILEMKAVSPKGRSPTRSQ